MAIKIGVIGATGMAGSAVYQEAVDQGFDVTAIVRSTAKAHKTLGQDAKVLEKDAFALTKEELLQFDVIINAFATVPALAYQHIDLAAYLIRLLRETTVPRLIFILGAGSLITGDDNHLLLEDLKKLPDAASWISIPDNQKKELEFLRNIDNVNWTGVSPGITFQAGEATQYKLGTDYLLFGEDNESVTNSGTMAKAIVSEIIKPSAEKKRFTVVNA
ncbi:NAD(P)-dependent oxidoreductase [Leuconostoc suionicum]|uniref:NAD(P)-dependent oxidoreductase n=1 Tax=Leuconostoc suionicum TaxID=1511761 RepID=UPI0024AE1761|nr:NAD(P)H-binding protein [Leuconostoc suionicum]MDI6523689.1 NAD(P)H-binding protein [Leuconostoc suionicum]MDI6544655.1 NAD(P)H-binding protein [Leuconostoc suionicum]MDI6551942.1 NAD(P)H-binding protein [Leuconostoc suionicum]MDI6649971.1 NAD(P)H-binding protein [Leuconostoc suionicum]MDI6681562.1 NAD(P)H-binding protein [Leuconostoc suionicum]